jgi:hypothetical protein
MHGLTIYIVGHAGTSSSSGSWHVAELEWEFLDCSGDAGRITVRGEGGMSGGGVVVVVLGGIGCYPLHAPCGWWG